MKKFVALLMALALLCTSVGAFATETPTEPADAGVPAPLADTSTAPTTGAPTTPDPATCEHETTKQVEKTAPTCTTKGEADVVCEACGATVETVEVDMVAHTPGVQTVTEEPQETVAGKWKIECTVCNTVVDEGMLPPTKIDELGVEESVWKNYDLTETIETPDSAPHVEGWVDPSRTVTASCTQEGVMFLLCTECGKEYSVKTEAEDHVDPAGAKNTYYASEEDKPTCTKPGVLTHKGCANCGDDTVWTTEEPMVPHTFGDVVTVPADCVNDEKSTKTCTVCGYVEETVAEGTALRHTFDRPDGPTDPEEHILKDATCTEKGAEGMAVVCDDCGFINGVDTVTETPVLIHEDHLKDIQDEWFTVTENDDGTVEIEVMAEEGSTTYVDPMLGVVSGGKIYGDVEVVYIPATCTEEGSIWATCEDCGAKVGTAIPALGHDFEIAREPQFGDKILDCTKVGSALLKCTRCDFAYNMIITPAKHHTWIEDFDDPDFDANVISYKQEKFSGPVVSEDRDDMAPCYPYEVTVECAVDYCEVEHTFTVYPDPENEDHKHKAETYLIDKPATCTTGSVQKYNCANCGWYQVETGDALGHDFTVKGTTTVEPTCTKDGERKMLCSREGCEEWITAVIPAVGHHYVLVESIAPDCRKDIEGKDTYVCSICGDVKEENTGDGHDDANGEVKAHLAETCTEDGSKTFICPLCHKSVTRVLPATGHSYEQPDYEHKHDDCIEPDCDPENTHGWIHVDTCTNTDERTGKVCGEKREVEDEATRPDDHQKYKTAEDGSKTLNRFVVETLPTCEKEGLAHYVCAKCDTEVDYVLPAIAHNMKLNFNRDEGVYEEKCGTVKSTNSGRLYNLLMTAGYEDMVARAIVELMATTGDYYIGIGCGKVNELARKDTDYEITDLGNGKGQIELVEGALPIPTEKAYVLITWGYTLKNGDTVSFTICREVASEGVDYDYNENGVPTFSHVGTFKLTGFKAPANAHLDYVAVEVVDDPDADILDFYDYNVYGSAKL